MKRLLALTVVAMGLVAGAVPVEWTFPRNASCHEGLAFSDGLTGVLVWGGGDTVKLTVGRADLWDHRGGYPWTEAQSYTNIVAAVRSGDKARLLGLFRKDTPAGEPRNPYMLPLGRVTLSVPGKTLVSGSLDPLTGLGELVFDDGTTAALAMGKPSRTFALRFSKAVAFAAVATPAMDYPIAGKSMRAVGFRDPVRFASAGNGGFVQELPADASVGLVWTKREDELEVRTVRGLSAAELQAQTDWTGHAQVSAESRAHWAAFWKRSARVEVPDPAIQRVFEYGMYRFGIMTDPDGVAAGLQGMWLEDDRLVPWCGDYHFNINVQECYSPAYRGGHLENLMPLFRMVRTWWPRLRDNARKFCGIGDGYVLPHSVDDRGVCIGGFWTGTIDHGSTAWTAALMYRYVSYSGDLEFLRTDAYPFMKGAMNVYRAMMEERDGRLSLPLGPSPEWCGDDVKKAVGRDPSFQLAAAHRLARDLIAAAKLLGETPDPMWLDVERRLPSYVADGSGILLFEGQRLTESHRHHSHMAGLYPFNTIEVTADAVRPAVLATYRTWVKMGTGMWSGWCVPWASILHTHIGNSEAAAHLIRSWDTFYCNDGHGSLHNAYRHGFSDMMMGSSGPKGELIDGSHIMQMDGQCAAVTAILEMMVHEVGGKTEYFRGCPSGWKRVAFENVLAPGGKRISGVRENGKVMIR